jgi:hypothetical protein
MRQVKLLRAFFLLGREDRKLLALASLTLAISWLRLRMHGIDRTRFWATRHGNGVVRPERLVWALTTVARRFPTTCLTQALALQRMLSINQYVTGLKIGVRFVGGEFEAHAWLLGDERILIGGFDTESYTILLE